MTDKEKYSDTITPDPIDSLIRKSVDRLDQSAGLPSNFAYRMAMRAAEVKSARTAAMRRREKLLSWIVPGVAAVAVIVAVALVVPTLPESVASTISSGAEESVSSSSLSVWGLIAGAFGVLMALNSIFRHKLLVKSKV